MKCHSDNFNEVAEGVAYLYDTLKLPLAVDGYKSALISHSGKHGRAKTVYKSTQSN